MTGWSGFRMGDGSRRSLSEVVSPVFITSSQAPITPPTSPAMTAGTSK